MSELKKTSLSLDPKEYEDFKKISKKIDSDASKEVRKFMKEFNKKHKHLLDEK